MKIPVLICDDSSLARKQMARSLPPEWDVDVSFAANGLEALEAIKAGKADVLFLDLNMPVMNGYEVLDAIRAQDLPTLVLVVSGDVQPDARRHVTSKGALDFVKKPVTTEKIREVLETFGITEGGAGGQASSDGAEGHGNLSAQASHAPSSASRSSFNEMLQEVVNVAMGQAGKLAAELLQVFIHLPVPVVHRCRYSELPGRLECRRSTALIGVSHGFTGNGISGEAVLLLDSGDLHQLLPLLRAGDKSTQNAELGLLIDLSGLLTGGCLQGISTQLDLELNHSYPVLLGQNTTVESLLGKASDPEVLAVEINYRVQEVPCHLLIIFTADSHRTLDERMELLQ